jgi:hypothetical protein
MLALALQLPGAAGDARTSIDRARTVLIKHLEDSACIFHGVGGPIAIFTLLPVLPVLFQPLDHRPLWLRRLSLPRWRSPPAPQHSNLASAALALQPGGKCAGGHLLAPCTLAVAAGVLLLLLHFLFSRYTLERLPLATPLSASSRAAHSTEGETAPAAPA